MNKYKIIFVIFLTILSFVLINKLAPSYAAPCDLNVTNPRADGLVSTGNFDASSKFYVSNSGTCITNSGNYSVALDDFNIPKYTDFKNQYFTRSKFANKKAVSQFSDIFTGADSGLDGVYLLTAGVTVSSTNTPTYTASDSTETKVIFIDGSLNINNNIIYHSGASDKPSGIVFVVRDNINIDKSVTQIDAVLISFGVICTGYEGGNCLPVSVTNALTVNGSIISLRGYNQADPIAIKFTRSLANNNNPAEIVNQQPKYLTILKDLMSEDLKITSEDTFFGEDPNLGSLADAPIPTPPPDTTAPTVAFVTPTAGSIVSKTVTFDAPAIDDSGVVAGVKFFVDGVLQVDDTSEPFTYVWNSGNATNGAHTLKAEARDPTGNISVVNASNQISVTVDNYYRVFLAIEPNQGNLNAAYTDFYSGTSGGPFADGTIGANARCNTAASNAKLGSTWRAWISESSVKTATANISGYAGYKTNYPIKLLNGTQVASSWANLLAPAGGNIAQTINRTEFNNKIVGGLDVWTSTGANGLFTGSNHCTTWTSNVNSPKGLYGGAKNSDGSQDAKWTNDTSKFCNLYANLYCFEVDYSPTPPTQTQVYSIQPYPENSPGENKADIFFNTSTCPTAVTTYYRKITERFPASNNTTFNCAVDNTTSPSSYKTTVNLTGLTAGSAYYFYTKATINGTQTNSNVNGFNTNNGP